MSVSSKLTHLYTFFVEYLECVSGGSSLGWPGKKNLIFNLAESLFCPAARWSWTLNNSKLILLLHSHHILSYMQATELFNCLYLWGMQTLLRAAPVWSIIKYNATWKCISHELRAWTSHSDFLLVIHFVWALSFFLFFFQFLQLLLFLSIYFTNFFLPYANNALLSSFWLGLPSATDIGRAIRSCHVWLRYYRFICYIKSIKPTRSFVLEWILIRLEGQSQSVSTYAIQKIKK